MAFLDRSSLIVDAVLTNKGRERLSSNSFEITKFALGDDEVDYRLYNEANTNGPNFYGVAIENMPILEATTRADTALKFKLITLPPGTVETPQVELGIPQNVSMTGEDATIFIQPSTLNMGGEDEDYIFELADDLPIEIVVGQFTAPKNVQEPGDVALEDPNLIVPEGSIGNFGTVMPGERVVFQLEDVFDASPGDILRVTNNYWKPNNGEYLIERITEGGKGFAVMARGKWANKEYRKFQYSIYRGNVSEKFKEEIQGKEQGIFNSPSPEKEVGKGDPNVPGGK
tara:strand:- start:3259 stop:4113 length:855 start_codon:yes stop_codon:yes gene_type:complete